MQRILVVDDDAAVRDLLKRGLSRAGYVIDEAESAETGLTCAFRAVPDLVVLDIMLPGFDGLHMLRRLRLARLPVRVLMLTAKTSTSDQIWSLDAGADDYVTKPFSWDILFARIRVLLRRGGEAPAALQYDDVVLDVDSRSVRRGGREMSLTNLEFQLLREFLTHPNTVLSKAMLLDRVWGYGVGSTNVVEVYVKQLRRKLGAANEPRLIHTVYGAGYVLRRAPS